MGQSRSLTVVPDLWIKSATPGTQADLAGHGRVTPTARPHPHPRGSAGLPRAGRERGARGVMGQQLTQ
jgi:hypothetical protein